MRWQPIIVLFAVVGLAGACSRDPKTLGLRYFEDGNRHFAQKNYPEAIIQYRNAVAKDGSLGEARFKLGLAYEATGDLRNALREYVRAADLMPDNVAAQLHAGKLLVAAGQFPEGKARAVAALTKEPKNVDGFIVMGNALAGMKDLDGAIVQIESAIDADPGLTFSYANLAVLELVKGDRSAAEDAFRRAIEIDPKSVPAHLTLANFYWASGKREEAERELKSAWAIDPKSDATNRALSAFYMIGGKRSEAEPYLKAYAAATSAVNPKVLLADFYLTDGRTKEAVSVLEPLSKDKDGFGPAKLRLADVDFGAGRQQQAYRTLEEVLKRYPANEETLDTKVRFLIADRKYDEAVKAASSAIAANPRALRSHYLLAVALEARNSTDEAIQAYQKVLELAPSAVPAKFGLARLYLAKHEGKAALEYLGQVVKAQPRSGIAHLLLGQALLQSGNLTGAEAELVPLAKGSPTNVDVQVWLGRLYGAEGNLARSRQAFNRALELQPDSVLALNGLVTLDMVEKKPAAARAKVESRLAAGSKDAPLLFLAASTFMNTGDAPKAEAMFQKVLEVDPWYINAYARLAGLYVSQHRLEDARKKYEEFARQQTKPVAATTLIGMIMELQDKPDEARKQYEHALALDPRAAVAANNLAWQYSETGGNLDVALQLAQTAKAQLPDNSKISDTLGWIYYKKGLGSQAIAALSQSTQQDPSDPITRYHLGLAYVMSGNRTEAQRSLQIALKLNPTFQGAEDARRALAATK